MARKISLPKPFSGRNLINALDRLSPPAQAGVLLNYDVKTKTITGRGFEHTVHVRLSMFGSTVINEFGGAVDDHREAFVTFTSNASGDFSGVFDPTDRLQVLPLDDFGGFLAGVAPGETMHFSANDERQDPSDPSHGPLWSNTLAIPVV
ncbi:hypothetical protein [Streptomyces sp. NRRL S-350]|uniref:hypothetical protein n=1 Tax=Streptomyces sp. NRRL S-350 TaxID=1463902 RepID=UPI00131B36BF|nr:hypothetical protein [Streptomyces sp. NRRL S-350]